MSKQTRSNLLIAAAFVLGLAFAPATADAAMALTNVVVKNTATNPVNTKVVRPVTVGNTVRTTLATEARAKVRTGRVGVVLREPNSADHATPAGPKFYAFSTRSLESIRISANGFSGTGTCNIQVSINGVAIRNWFIGQFQNVSEVFEAPGTRVNVAVNTPDNCWIFLGAVGTRLS